MESIEYSDFLLYGKAEVEMYAYKLDLRDYKSQIEKTFFTPEPYDSV